MLKKCFVLSFPLAERDAVYGQARTWRRGGGG